MELLEDWKIVLFPLLKKLEDGPHTLSHAEHISGHFEKRKDWHKAANFFFEKLEAAEFHWFFVQGLDALMHEFYVPATSSFLNGIEASLRVTLAQVENTKIELGSDGISPYKVLSNKLIKSCGDVGMPIKYLAFPNELDFLKKLESKKPNIVSVEIVRQRNNICHGDITEYIDTSLGPQNSFFTPVSLRSLCFDLLMISGNWSLALSKFRKDLSKKGSST